MPTTTYSPSATFTNVSYCPPDHTAYTATTESGQRFSIFYPIGTPADYPDVYGLGCPPTTKWKTLLIENLSGGAGTTGSSSAVPLTSIAASAGIAHHALERGFAVVSAQKTSHGTGGAGVNGLGFPHHPGGIEGFYESRNRPSFLKDSVLIIQNIRWNARNYPYGHASSYGLSGWICQHGTNSGYGQWWIGSAPSRACELGSGGPYEESTVPETIIGQALYIYDVMKYSFADAEFGALFSPAGETGGPAFDSVVAATLAAAPQRYVRGFGAASVISDLGQPCHPMCIFFSNTGPEDLNFGEPLIEGVRAYTTGVHDGWQMLAMKQALPPGWVELRLAPSAQRTLSATQASSTAIPTPYFDGQLASPVSGHVASTGSIAFSAAPADGNTITMGDGFQSVTFEFDSGGGVTAGNVAVTGFGTAAAAMTSLLAAITTAFGVSGTTLTWVAGTPSTVNTAFTSAATDIAANFTWSKVGGNITVTGLASGVSSGQAISGESPQTGSIINWLVRHSKDERWDKTLPPCGIRVDSQVNTQGRCIVPPARDPSGNYNGRTHVRLTCTSLPGDSDLLWGHSHKRMRGRLKPGETVVIETTGKLWARSAGGGTQVAKYSRRECDERSL